MNPPKATVGRKELVERCDAAGEGAEVEYDLEVQDRANGRGVKGVDLRVVAPSQPGGEGGPSGDDAGIPEGGLSLDEAIARLVDDGGHLGKTARRRGHITGPPASSGSCRAGAAGTTGHTAATSTSPGRHGGRVTTRATT